MLRVAIDAGPLHGHRTGIGNAVAWTIDALRAEHRPGSGAEIALLPYVTSARARLSDGERRLPVPAALAHRIWARWNRPAMDRWLGRPDVVHGMNYVVPPARAPRIVTVHDCWFAEHPEEAHPDVVRASRVLERSIADGAQVIASSDATRDRVRQLFETDAVDTVHLGPPPHDPAAPSTAPSSGVPHGPFVLAIGTVERRKNLPTLVRAFGRVAQDHPTVELHLVGRDGDDSPALTRAIDRLAEPIRPRVVRHRDVGDDVKRWLLDHAAALAYPSLDEGFGFPILEAQQAGTPVVGSSAGSIPEIAGAGALLSLPLDVDALAAHLFWVLDSPEMRDRLVARGRANLERFSWCATAARLVEHYHRAAER